MSAPLYIPARRRIAPAATSIFAKMKGADVPVNGGAA